MLVICSCNTSLYLNKKGVINVPKKENYTVTYKANLKDGVVARINYTDESDRLAKIKDVTGNWEKTVVLNAGKHVKIKVLAAGAKTSTDFKVLVDGKIISEYTLNGKKAKYSFNFDLP
jgi:hypothetical protein